MTTSNDVSVDDSLPDLDTESDLIGDDANWLERALCAQTDPDAFFPEKGGSTRDAKKICIGCEVRSACLSAALRNDERFGIWGGLSERERRRLKLSPIFNSARRTNESGRPSGEALAMSDLDRRRKLFNLMVDMHVGGDSHLTPDPDLADELWFYSGIFLAPSVTDLTQWLAAEAAAGRVTLTAAGDVTDCVDPSAHVMVDLPAGADKTSLNGSRSEVQAGNVPPASYSFAPSFTPPPSSRAFYRGPVSTTTLAERQQLLAEILGDAFADVTGGYVIGLATKTGLASKLDFVRSATDSATAQLDRFIAGEVEAERLIGSTDSVGNLIITGFHYGPTLVECRPRPVAVKTATTQDAATATVEAVPHLAQPAADRLRPSVHRQSTPEEPAVIDHQRQSALKRLFDTAIREGKAGLVLDSANLALIYTQLHFVPSTRRSRNSRHGGTQKDLWQKFVASQGNLLRIEPVGNVPTIVAYDFQPATKAVERPQPVAAAPEVAPPVLPAPTTVPAEAPDDSQTRPEPDAEIELSAVLPPDSEELIAGEPVDEIVAAVPVGEEEDGASTFKTIEAVLTDDASRPVPEPVASAPAEVAVLASSPTADAAVAVPAVHGTGPTPLRLVSTTAVGVVANLPSRALLTAMCGPARPVETKTEPKAAVEPSSATPGGALLGTDDAKRMRRIIAVLKACGGRGGKELNGSALTRIIELGSNSSVTNDVLRLMQAIGYISRTLVGNRQISIELLPAGDVFYELAPARLSRAASAHLAELGKSGQLLTPDIIGGIFADIAGACELVVLQTIYDQMLVSRVDSLSADVGLPKAWLKLILDELNEAGLIEWKRNRAGASVSIMVLPDGIKRLDPAPVDSITPSLAAVTPISEGKRTKLHAVEAPATAESVAPIDAAALLERYRAAKKLYGKGAVARLANAYTVAVRKTAPGRSFYLETLRDGLEALDRSLASTSGDEVIA